MIRREIKGYISRTGIFTEIHEEESQKHIPLHELLEEHLGDSIQIIIKDYEPPLCPYCGYPWDYKQDRCPTGCFDDIFEQLEESK